MNVQPESQWARILYHSLNEFRRGTSVAGLAILSDVITQYLDPILEYSSQPKMIIRLTEHDSEAFEVTHQPAPGCSFVSEDGDFSDREVMDRLVNTLRHNLWATIAPDTGILCPDCRGDYLVIAKKDDSQEICLHCTTCYLSYWEDGEVTDNRFEEGLVPPLKSEMQNYTSKRLARFIENVGLSEDD